MCKRHADSGCLSYTFSVTKAALVATKQTRTPNTSHRQLWTTYFTRGDGSLLPRWPRSFSSGFSGEYSGDPYWPGSSTKRCDEIPSGEVAHASIRLSNASPTSESLCCSVSSKVEKPLVGSLPFSDVRRDIIVIRVCRAFGPAFCGEA